MEGLATQSELAFNASIRANAQWQPKKLRRKQSTRSSSADLLLRFGVSVFDLDFGGSLIDIDASADYEQITITAVIDSSVSALVTLRNEPPKNLLSPLKINELSLRIIANEPSAFLPSV